MNVIKQNLLSVWNNEVPALSTELGQNLPPLFSSQGELLLPGGEQQVRVRVALEQRQQVFGSRGGGGGEDPGPHNQHLSHHHRYHQHLVQPWH